jgi:DNA polymerase phi
MGTKRKRTGQASATATPPAKKQNKNNNNQVAKPQQKQKQKAAPKPPAVFNLDASPFVNDPRGDELKREVQLYDILSSEDPAERLNAATAIISGLLDGEGVEEATLQRHLERRLFRGLASGRKGARLGYSVVITEILGQLFGAKALAEEKYTGLTFEKVLGFLVAKTKPEGDLSGQEEKDHHFGLLFGLQSFVRAKALFQDSARWKSILEKLLELAKKKPWIREECGWVVVEALAQLDESQTIYTLEQLVEAGLALTPEGVGIWLMAKNKFPDAKLPAKPWGKSSNPLDNLQSLSKALKESSSSDESSAKAQSVKSGSWNPQLHFVWNLVLSHYAEGKAGSSDFEHFWKVAVDGKNMFNPISSEADLSYRQSILGHGFA